MKLVTLKDNRKRSGLGRTEEGFEWVDLARSGLERGLAGRERGEAAGEQCGLSALRGRSEEFALVTGFSRCSRSVFTSSRCSIASVPLSSLLILGLDFLGCVRVLSIFIFALYSFVLIEGS